MRPVSPLRFAIQASIWQLALLFLVTLSVSAPLNISIDSVEHGNDASILESRDVKPFPLRVLPLGASITVGFKSSDGNGYRKWLRQQLRYAGWQVDMVGNLKNGTMHNNNNDGYKGYKIHRIAKEAEKTIPQQPNVILINAGTNDAVRKYHVDTAGKRMDALLTRLFNAIPGTTIVLSTLLPNKRQPNLVDQINAQYRNITARRRERNERIVLAEMNHFITVDELVDGTHPNDYGYKKMASVWWAAIQEAEKEGLLQQSKNTARGHSKALGMQSDDAAGNPHLPEYKAPKQPENDGGLRFRQPCSWQVVLQMVASMSIYCSL
ncbi:SGNH/GDSL hydrolase family protein [Aspergillus tanneri]|uniref:SGNH hydrolase-type esterase domain-containing protein n=1 Tax=Aspergillus tanneri TaxID=1220188 RepID=A0A5M9M8S1_9EURO|nr:uncharacterized protein ATNIH1004_010945 [Aspergillus tanneri]KAA8642006.1 hypothetical protein ATNIH1004_010945 [Aspergillus tanneri]